MDIVKPPCPFRKVNLWELSGSDLPEDINIIHLKLFHHNKHYNFVVSVDDDLI